MKLLSTIVLILCALVTRAQEPGSTITVYFDFNKYELREDAREAINDYLRGKPVHTLQVELRGHCDSIGSHAYNDVLSMNRTQSVRRYLISLGMPVSAIGEAKGFGKRSPVMDNQSEEGRARNRRVELIFGPVSQQTELKEKLADTTAIVGTNITLRNINFEGGRSIFLRESYPALKELLDALKAFPRLEIRIEGHICCQQFEDDGLDMGTGYYNLSEARAKAVHDYLIENGIEAARLSYKGFGHSQPLYPYPENSEEERIANRRVELRIIKK